MKHKHRKVLLATTALVTTGALGTLWYNQRPVTELDPSDHNYLRYKSSLNLNFEPPTERDLRDYIAALASYKFGAGLNKTFRELNYHQKDAKGRILITYTFDNFEGNYIPPVDASDFRLLNEKQREVMRLALLRWEEVANIKFVETKKGSPANWTIRTCKRERRAIEGEAHGSINEDASLLRNKNNSGLIRPVDILLSQSSCLNLHPTNRGL